MLIFDCCQLADLLNSLAMYRTKWLESFSFELKSARARNSGLLLVVDIQPLRLPSVGLCLVLSLCHPDRATHTLSLNSSELEFRIVKTWACLQNFDRLSPFHLSYGNDLILVFHAVLVTLRLSQHVGSLRSARVLSIRLSILWLDNSILLEAFVNELLLKIDSISFSWYRRMENHFILFAFLIGFCSIIVLELFLCRGFAWVALSFPTEVHVHVHAVQVECSSSATPRLLTIRFFKLLCD